MNSSWRRITLSFRLSIGVVCLSVLVLSLGGCASLRKKFVRQKKKAAQEEEFIPVLDPVDYAPAVVSAEERYAYHYSLWKVWYRDLIENIEYKTSDKKQKYLLGEVIVQLEEMSKWMVDEKRQELNASIREWEAIRALYEEPAPARSMSTLRKKIESNAQKIRQQFNPEAVHDFLVLHSINP